MSTEKILTAYAQRQTEKLRNIENPASAHRPGIYPVITLSMEPGSGGSLVAQKVANMMGFDYFNRELLEVVAKRARVTPQVLAKLEHERFSGIQDFIACLLDPKYLWPGVYLEHLQNMVNAISGRGHAVLVGRGANFILPAGNRMSVRIVAPMALRVENVMREFSVTEEEANKRVSHRESRRSAFVKNSFHADINKTVHYDIVINMKDLTLDTAAEMVCAAWVAKFYVD